MKGIIILEFDENDNPSISTQFPVNVCEFLKVDPKVLQPLSEQHLVKKMEPNYIEMKLTDDITVSSFYTGFSFRHYVGKPNYAIIVFLSEDDFLINDFEGMMRRIAYELLPKKEALNFDDIFGRYYDMLKNEELTPYWEETIEGETSKVVKEEFEKTKIEKEKLPHQQQIEDNIKKEKEPTPSEETEILRELEDKISDLESLVNEKSSKIRELTNKFTEVKSENTNLITVRDKLKKELSEQYIKLESWSQQMADLNENNAKLMTENKSLNLQIEQKQKVSEQKEKEVEQLQKKLHGFDDVGREYEKIIQEKEDLRVANRSLNSEVQTLEKTLEKIKSELEKVKNQNSIHIDSITSLKLEIKDLKDQLVVSKDGDSDLKDQILDLKKEIKVLRRERDHYMKIVKENDLL